MKMDQKQKVYLIGIAGGSASGKTHLLRELRKRFNEKEICILSQDNYYKPIAEQFRDTNGMVNFDLPTALDEAQFIHDMRLLSDGKEVHQKEYTFNQASIKGKTMTLKPAPVVVAEGLFIFHFGLVRDMLDLKIFLDASEETKLFRRLERDNRERGMERKAILYQWHQHVSPAYRKYLLPHREMADLIINNNDSLDEGIELITAHIESALRHLKNRSHPE
jgi:uridine kinase